MSSMQIRQAIRDDIAALFQLSCDAHQQAPYTELIPASERQRFLAAFSPGSRFETRFREKMERFIDSPNARVYVAEVDGKIAGYRMAERAGTQLMLHGLFVDARYRGMGIGRELFTKPLADVLPGDTVLLTVLRGNAHARRLYESEGFVVTRESPRTFYGAKQDEMMLKK